MNDEFVSSWDSSGDGSRKKKPFLPALLLTSFLVGWGERALWDRFKAVSPLRQTLNWLREGEDRSKGLVSLSYSYYTVFKKSACLNAFDRGISPAAKTNNEIREESWHKLTRHRVQRAFLLINSGVGFPLLSGTFFILVSSNYRRFGWLIRPNSNLFWVKSHTYLPYFFDPGRQPKLEK